MNRILAQEPIPLVGDAMMRLMAMAKTNECAECGSGLMAIFSYEISRSFGQRTLGWVRCRANADHKGIRKPPRRIKPYGIK